MNTKIVFKIILWLTWLSAVQFSILMAHFMKADVLHKARPFDTFATGMFLIPILFCGGFRFWLSRTRNPWVALFPFFGGLFFAWQPGTCAIFLLPEFHTVFQILSAVLFLAFLPAFVRLREVSPPIPTTQAEPLSSGR